MKTSKLFSIIAILLVTSLLMSCTSGYRISRRYVDVEPISGQEKCELIIFNENSRLVGHPGGFAVRVDDTIFGYIMGREHLRLQHYTGNRVLILERKDVTHFTTEHKIELQEGQNIYQLSSKHSSHIVERLDSLPPNFNPYRDKIPVAIKVEGIKIEEKPKVKWYSL